jgi:type VI secretion system secreted protein Hcp
MRGLLAFVGVAGALFLAANPACAAAVDYFLQIDGIHGPSTTMPGAIELSSFSWGASRGVTAPTGAAADRDGSSPSVSEITVTKAHDSTSPLLLQASTNATHFSSATLYVRKAGNSQEFLRYELTDVLVSSYQTGGSGGGADRPVESLTFKFATIHVEDTSGGINASTAPATTVSSNPWAH